MFYLHAFSLLLQVSGEESPGVLSNEDLPDSPTDGDIDEESLTTNMPWLKVCLQIEVLNIGETSSFKYVQPKGFLLIRIFAPFSIYLCIVM